MNAKRIPVLKNTSIKHRKEKFQHLRLRNQETMIRIVNEKTERQLWKATNHSLRSHSKINYVNHFPRRGWNCRILNSSYLSLSQIFMNVLYIFILMMENPCYTLAVSCQSRQAWYSTYRKDTLFFFIYARTQQ